MSMTRNPHAAIAERVKNLSAMAREGGEDRPDLLVRMQAEATLALAYEQRTANLIACQALGITDMTDWAPAHSAEWINRAKEVSERLGATK